MTPTVAIPIDVAREALRAFDRAISELYGKVGNEGGDGLRDGLPSFVRSMAIADLKLALKCFDAINSAMQFGDPGHSSAIDTIIIWARAVVEQHGHEVAA
jgi:hypothetical protein